MTDFQRPPRDNLVRALAGGVTLGDDGKTLVGRIAPANEWAEIHSSVEGHFLERNVPGAFKKTFAELTPKIQFQHGRDPELGNRLIAEPIEFGEDERGGFYRGEVLPGLPQLILEGLKRGLYGSSHTFTVIREKWVDSPPKSAENPNGLPERTIIEARVPELGPVTWPAFAGAFAGVRSMTDFYTLDTLTADPERLAALIEATREDAPPDDGAGPEPTPSEDAASPPEAPPPEVASTESQDPPEGGSSDSRSESVDYTTIEDKAARVSELEAVLQRTAAEQTGVLSVEAQARWDADSLELKNLKADIAAVQERQAFLRTIAADPGRTEPTYSPPQVMRTHSTADIYDPGQYGFGMVRSQEDRDQKLRDNAMRSLETSTFGLRNADDGRAKDGVANLLDNHDSRDKELARRILGTGSPQYKRAFEKYLRGEQQTPEEQRAAALAVVGTTTTGGYSIPYTFDPSFIKTGAWTNINPYRQVCRVEQIVGSNNWQGVSVGAVPAIYETEALAVTEAGPTFARPSLTAQRASSYVTVSYETLQDRTDIVEEISNLIQEGKDTLEEAQYSIGIGSGVYPLGMFVKSTFTVKETITDNTFAVADLDATEAALPIRHRRDAIWMLSRGVIRIIQGFETAYGKYFNSTLGYPAVGDPANNPGGNTGLNLLGYPVFETPSAPVTVTGDDTIVGILVSPKNYMILDRVGMNVEVIQNVVNGDGAPTGQRAILALWRNTARALNADAGRQININ